MTVEFSSGKRLQVSNLSSALNRIREQYPDAVLDAEWKSSRGWQERAVHESQFAEWDGKEPIAHVERMVR